MKSRKILAVIALLVGIITLGVNYFSLESSKRKIKVMEYKSPVTTIENSCEIQKYENIKNVQWLYKNEVLALTKRSEQNDNSITADSSYCNTYNIKTKNSKEFKDANIGKILGVSPDKKLVLYSEPEEVAQVEGPNRIESSIDSGENLKLLNLSTGEFVDLVTEGERYAIEYRWISNNKIIGNYRDSWKVFDIDGKVYQEGNYAAKEVCPLLVGVDNLKDLGDSVEGKFYYSQLKAQEVGGELNTLDVNTKELKTIYSSCIPFYADKKGETIILSSCSYKNALTTGFGVIIIDESGNVIKEINLYEGKEESAKYASNYVLSPDGSKAAYIQSDALPSSSDMSPELSVNVLDIKTGTKKQIVNLSSLNDNSARNSYSIIEENDKDGNAVKKKTPEVDRISNICWNNSGAALSFTFGDSYTNGSEFGIDTYIVSFDK